ncbi:MAG: hypothetical protein ACLQNG_14030 [Acidimicrobiales bacterium]|jgi:hypothetical protein
MRSLLVLTASVLGLIGIGIGAMSAAGQGALADPGQSHALRTSAQPPGSAASGLCGSVSSITGAVVHRVVALPQNHPKFSFPAVVRIRSTGAAKRVARTLCALPRFPEGVYSCPVDLGISYNIEFSLAGATKTVSVNPWGCETVGGAISPRRATSGMWPVLGSAMGLRHATRSTFAGTIPGS